MVTLARAPTSGRAGRIGEAIGSAFGKSFVPSFQRTTEQLNQQQQFNPIREALMAQIQGGGDSPGQNLIRQITSDPNIFAQVMENPQMAQTLMSLNEAGAPADDSLTGISGLDEINKTFDAAQTALADGEPRRAEILFSRVNELAGVPGKVDPKLDLFQLFRAGSEEPIPVQPAPGGGIQDIAGNKLVVEPGDRLLESSSITGGIESVLGQTERRNLNDAQVATQNFIATAGDALNLIDEEPGANTLTGRAAALFGDLKAEAVTFGNALGLDFEPSQLDPATYTEQFKSLGVTNPRMQSLITSLAFQAAAAAGSRGQSVSNRDIERFINQVGGNAANPEAFKAVLRDEAARTARNFRNNFSVRLGKEFEGDLGMGALDGSGVPPLAPVDITNLSDEDLLNF